MIGLFINIIVWILVLGILYWLAIYVIDAIPLPQPANRVAKLVITVLIVLVVLLLLLQLVGVDLGGARLPTAHLNP